MINYKQINWHHITYGGIAILFAIWLAYAPIGIQDTITILENDSERMVQK